MKRYEWIILIFVFAAGCAPWTQVGGLYKNENDNFTVDLPQDWMKSNQEKHLFITRDGVLLQNIQIVRLKLEEPLKHTKKKFSRGMLPQEAAETILDDIASNLNHLNVEIIENLPVTISGMPGFKATYTYKNKDDLKLKSIYYGFIAGDWFFGINYNAPQRYYFDKDIKTFEKVIESFRLIKSV